MFNSLITKVRGWLHKMGLIKGVQKIADLKGVQVDEDFYKHIDKWKALYAGFYADWHDIQYQTLKGPKKRIMATLNMPKVVSNEMASLIFNERCEINISDDGLSEFIHEVLKDNSFIRNYQEHLEFTFAMGGGVLKPYIEEDQIKLSYVTADCFIPLAWNNKRVTEAVFPNEFRKGDKKYTHLEWHVWEGSEYVIKNEVYQADGTDTLGIKVNLKQFFPDLSPETRIKSFKLPGFVYIKPNTANNIDPKSPLGISLFANALDTIKSLDVAFDSYQREFSLGKKRIIVPAAALKTVVDPQTGQVHRYFDSEDEVYQAFNFSNDAEAQQFKDVSATLRVTEHIAAINSLLNILAMQTGFSAGAFSFDGQGVKTATEVVSENSKTFRTKQSHENTIEAGLQDLVAVILQYAELYELYSGPDKFEVTVSFDDSIAEDQNAEITKQIQLVSNKLTSRKKAIMKIWGFTEKEAEDLMEEISKENATATAEAIDLFGVNKTGEGAE